MIRQWFILAVLSAAAVFVFADFVQNALLYDPLSEMEGVKAPEAERAEPLEGFEHAWGQEIAEKNLFSPQRGFAPPPPPMQPSEAQLQPPPPPPPVRPNFSLNGIILNQYGEYVAYVQVNNEKAVPLREGDAVSGAKVTMIDERSVEMIWNNEVVRLSLSRIKSVRGR